MYKRKLRVNRTLSRLKIRGNDEICGARARARTLATTRIDSRTARGLFRFYRIWRASIEPFLRDYL